MMETGVVIAGMMPVFWHLPAGRTGGSLPDSNELWDVLWKHRVSLNGFAHSHPGSGVPGPSHTDMTTFDAVERGLGRPLQWWIVSRDGMVLVLRQAVSATRWTAESRALTPDQVFNTHVIPLEDEPDWVPKLREHSYVPDPAPRYVPAL